MNETLPPSRARRVPATRLARLGRMGGLATGLAGDVALGAGRALARGERPRLDRLVLTPGTIGRIAERLSEMRGAAMKLGQLLSMETGDMLPPELAQILARLRAEAHVMPPQQLRSVLEESYGADFRKRFKGFDTRPLAAASIGQVHRATAADGMSLAVKLQYPGVRAAIDSDLDNAAALIRWSGLLPRELDLGPLLAEARTQLHDEADYDREGRYLARFGALLRHDPRVVVPVHRPDLSAPGALAMSFEPSEPIETLAEAPPGTRDAAMTALIELCLRELFEFRLMQTDPNFANYRWRPDTGQIVLLDFGATREIVAEVAEGHMALLRAGMARDREAVLAALEALGFVRPGLSERHRTAILEMGEMGFAALDGPLDFATADLPERMRRRGMEIGSERELWHIPPAETLFLQRKIGGLYLLAARIGARVDFPALLAPYAAP
ncbi:AarF/ABC1/UbiB kinase family protein [Roseibacterium sp. SDUM158016]|uniref:ABC1 kinase family protein n=1 Tax=Roseicyclus sediminis TaxID=2980997 RepID=UPI0021CE5C5A|nr:AarF/ABC1/UbiB kinase family protein [Roseibacterium sp. SDUM158016]MCU4654035.1 AarF/ABC1/UbiB kinase family protein [Roseibacterium sp. SDUM158016]